MIADLQASGLRADSTRERFRTWSDRLSRALERVGPWSPPSPEATVERGWPLPKIPLVLRCAAPSGEAAVPDWWSFYFLGSGKIPYLCRTAVRDGIGVYLADLHAVLHRFPKDAQLPEIDRVLESREILSIVRDSVAGLEVAREMLKVRALGYKPSRRLTLELRFETRRGRQEVIYLKVFQAGQDRSVVEAQRAMEGAQGSESNQRLGPAPLLGWSPQWNAVLWGEVSDPSVLELMSLPAGEEAVGRAARALAELQSSDVGWQRQHDRRREIQTLESWITAASYFDPASSTALHDRLGGLRRCASEIEHRPMVPSHRDFYDKQILIGSDRCTLLDLEVAGRAEAELDAGNFLAHLILRRLQAGNQAERRYSEVFLASYLRERRTTDLRLLRWYVAASLLRLSCVYAMRHEWPGLPTQLLDSCDRALRGELFFERSS